MERMAREKRFPLFVLHIFSLIRSKYSYRSMHEIVSEGVKKNWHKLRHRRKKRESVSMQNYRKEVDFKW